MKQIQEWLGHASFSTTADIYSHLDYTSKIQSANKIAGALDKTSVSKKDSEDTSITENVSAYPDKELTTLKELIAEIGTSPEALLKYFKELREKRCNDAGIKIIFGNNNPKNEKQDDFEL